MIAQQHQLNTLIAILLIVTVCWLAELLGKGEARQFIFTVGMVLCEGFLVAVSQPSKGVAVAPLTG